MNLIKKFTLCILLLLTSQSIFADIWLRDGEKAYQDSNKCTVKEYSYMKENPLRRHFYFYQLPTHNRENDPGSHVALDLEKLRVDAQVGPAFCGSDEPKTPPASVTKKILSDGNIEYKVSCEKLNRRGRTEYKVNLTITFDENMILEKLSYHEQGQNEFIGRPFGNLKTISKINCANLEDITDKVLSGEYDEHKNES